MANFQQDAALLARLARLEQMIAANTLGIADYSGSGSGSGGLLDGGSRIGGTATLDGGSRV